MNRYVADTHALLWYLLNSPQLGVSVSSAFDEGEQGQAVIYVPAIAVAELYFSVKKFGYALDFAAELATMQQKPHFAFVPFEVTDALDFDRDAQVSEMHDRIIVGVARRLNAALLTRDSQIVASGLVQTIW